MRHCLFLSIIFILAMQLNCFGPNFFINKTISNLQDHVDSLELNKSQNEKWLKIKSTLKLRLKQFISNQKALIFKVKKMLKQKQNDKEILSFLYHQFDTKDSLIIEFLDYFETFNSYLNKEQKEKLSNIVEDNLKQLNENLEYDINHINKEDDILIESLVEFKEEIRFDTKQKKQWENLKNDIIKAKKKYYVDFRKLTLNLSKKMASKSIVLNETIIEFRLFFESRPTPFQLVIDHCFQFYNILKPKQKLAFRKYLIHTLNDFEDFFKD